MILYRFMAFCLGLLLVLPFGAKGTDMAREDWEVAPEGTEVVCGPWVQNVTEDGFTVMWVTKGKCLSWVETAPDDGTHFQACQRPRVYQTMAGKRYVGTYHSVRVSGLEPGTVCRYRILAKEVLDDSCFYSVIYGRELSAPAQGKVRTLDYGAATCRFSMVNDIHDRGDMYRALVGPAAEAGMDFLVLNGDIVTTSDCVDTVAEHIFGYIADVAANYPVVYARGNHEGRGADSYRVADLFDSPTGEFYYIFRQGPAAFVVLDGGEDKPDCAVEYSGLADYDGYREAQLVWLKEAVKDPLFADAPVKIAICHIPPFNYVDSWYTQRWLRENVTPVLNEAGVDLMLSGHEHRLMVAETGECGNDFPIIANGNETRADVVVDSAGVKVVILGADGTKVCEWKSSH